MRSQGKCVGERRSSAPLSLLAMGTNGSGQVVIRRPAWGRIGEAVWCRWGTDKPGKVDRKLWTKAKLSEFYAEVEAARERGEDVRT